LTPFNLKENQSIFNENYHDRVATRGHRICRSTILIFCIEFRRRELVQMEWHHWNLIELS